MSMGGVERRWMRMTGEDALAGTEDNALPLVVATSTAGVRTPVYQATGASTSGAGTLTPAWPSHQTNDIGVLVVVSNNEVISTPATWNLIGTAQSVGSTTTTLTLFWRRAASGFETAPSITSSTFQKYARIYTVRNCTTLGIPYDVSLSGANNTSGTSLIWAASTTKFKNELVTQHASYTLATSTPQTSAFASTSFASVTAQFDEATTSVAGGAGAAVFSGTFNQGDGYASSTATMATSGSSVLWTLTWRSVWQVDAKSNIALPYHANEWAAFNAVYDSRIATPDDLWLLDDSGSPVADAIGSITLALTGSATFLSSVNGWSKFAIKFADGGTNNLFSTSASLPNITTTSGVLLAYVAVIATPGGARPILTLGTNTNAEFQVTAAQVYQATSAGNTSTGTAKVPTTVACLILKFDRTNTAQANISLIDVIVPTFGSGSGGAEVRIGGLSSNSAPMAVLYAALWKGANAELANSVWQGLQSNLGFYRTAGGASFINAIADSTAITDAMLGGLAAAPSLAESVGVSDAATALKAATVALADSEALSDSLAASLGKVVALADSLGLAEALAALYAANVAPSDSLALSDAIAVLQATSVSLADSESLAESLAAVKASTVPLAEALSLAESVTALKAATVPLADSLSLADAITALLAATVALADSLALSDSIQVTTNGQTVSLSDSLSLSDALTALLAATVPAADTDSLAESLAATKASTTPLADSAATSDSLSATMAATAPLADSESLADSVATLRTAAAGLADSLASTEALLALAARAIGLVESMSDADALSARVSLTALIAEQLNGVDSLAAQLVAALGLADSVSLADLIQVVVTHASLVPGHLDGTIRNVARLLGALARTGALDGVLSRTNRLDGTLVRR